VLFAACDRDLKYGRSESSWIVNGRRLSVNEMRALVDYAERVRILRDRTHE